MQKEDVQTTIEKLEAALNELEEGKSTYSDFGAYFHDELAEAVLHISVSYTHLTLPTMAVV